MRGLYGMADAGTLAVRGVGLRRYAEALRDAGVGVVQWRCKGNAREVLEGARVLRGVFPAGCGTLLVMNDRADLAVLAGFEGVHVGQDDLTVADVRRVNAGLMVGVSTHTEAQVRAADAAGVDYVAVGPVFGTTTKTDAAAVVGLEGVRMARGLTRRTLVGIGGIGVGNCAAVFAAGADMVAVIGGMWG